ncbi:MAG: alkaline phosphatase PhoX [Cyanobacteria bacterium P01_A01_bin.84]
MGHTNRRNFLFLMAGSAGAAALGSLAGCDRKVKNSSIDSAKSLFSSFEPVKGPIPIETSGFKVEEQQEKYRDYKVVDDLVLPSGFEYHVIAAWGDKVGDSRFGYNNDYLSFVPISENEGYLSVNFEYISAIPWTQTYQQVIGKSLPFDQVKTELKKDSSGKNEKNAYALSDNDPIKASIVNISAEALLDQGLGIISIRKASNGQWERTNSPADRRITGISGLRDDRYLGSTGPATVVFRKKQGLGYIDTHSDRIIGSFANCAGGTTPWGTVLSAEENFQAQVPEPVYADGTSFDPSTRPFVFTDKSISGQGNVFGLAGNKYGWIVEVDPSNPQDYGTKHTWLGRFRHEAVGVRVEVGKPIAFYSGCDRRSGHIYKFVSQGKVRDPKDKNNSQLLSQGMLYVAKFDPNGTGRWIALKADTPVDPDLPSNIVGNLIRLPKGPPEKSNKDDEKQTLFPIPERVEGGDFPVTDDKMITKYKQKYQTLGELYIGNSEEKQGAILIDAHYAANAAGATCTARPEDTEIAPNGDLYISFTSGSPDKEGGPDARIFKGPKGEIPYEYGWIVQLTEDKQNPTADTFRWQILATGGEPQAGGHGFANPDNLLLDSRSNVWMVTDISTGKLNNAVKSRTSDKGKVTNSSGIYGNNTIWYIPTSGDRQGKAFLFGIGPMECEVTGPCFSPNEDTIFLSIQHPGEANGIRENQASETREYAIYTTKGEEFIQTRQVPIGSNWPGKNSNALPKPAVVAVITTKNS